MDLIYSYDAGQAVTGLYVGVFAVGQVTTLVVPPNLHARVADPLSGIVGVVVKLAETGTTHPWHAAVFLVKVNAGASVQVGAVPP